MFFKKIRDMLSGESAKLLRQQKVEDEFNNGNIVLPTGLRDFKNYDEFKAKTSELKGIQEQLNTIENNGK